MSFYANWSISGVNFDSSADAFIKSAQHITNPKVLKKHEQYLNKRFKEHLDKNMMRAGMEADNLSDVFAMQINSKGINFVNTEPIVTQRYEYGYYEGSNDTNEEYYEEYILETSPRYFIRPAIQATLKDIGTILLQEAQKEYLQHRQREDTNTDYHT